MRQHPFQFDFNLGSKITWLGLGTKTTWRSYDIKVLGLVKVLKLLG